jgi:hypothetical protein
MIYFLISRDDYNSHYFSGNSGKTKYQKFFYTVVEIHLIFQWPISNKKETKDSEFIPVAH